MSTGLTVLVDGLTKRFGSVVALDGVDFEVPSGTVFGLPGPNGAGKTRQGCAVRPRVAEPR